MILFNREIDKGKYVSSDTFAHYEVIIEKREVLLLSDHRILYCERNDLFGGWQVCNRFTKIRSIDIFMQLFCNFLFASPIGHIAGVKFP